MSRKARVWIGVTILAVLVSNYLAIAVPLYKRVFYLDDKVKVFAKHSEDTYVADILKREIVAIDKKIFVLNCVGVSMAIVILSWIIFGLALRREDRRKL